ncbi:sensor histidine kinase [Lacrimispora celerecrescens]|uniref:histidine kinase n=1 Tax=[Clostridium] celerecrescens 18A TaxID=1286362 RepID=A0A2M8Z4T2_9FIRM|nr:HAMP domain-containing sensor histidine kinase [Lacrimispora celerecrescens]PJJ28453.1 signal transduction histidine kinase [[Clostridium] celerecrescens 18A]
MNLFRDKQFKYFSVFILTFVLLIFLSGIGLNAVQKKAVHGLFLSHDNAVVTSFLEQGVSKDVIAKAITSTTNSQEGKALLANIGVTEHTAIRFLPFIAEFQKISESYMLLFGMLLSSLLLVGAFIFLWKREQLYLQAAKVITNFTESDFSCHMPQMNEGTIYRLFASVEQLATILQSKSEASQKAKEFLKSTISDISHQLKTPLAALTMYHEIIADEPDHVQTVMEYSQKTELALKRMDQLIQVMLKITRLDAGSIAFEKESCRISNLIAQAVSELTTRAASEGKEIIVDETPEETLLCDQQWTSEAIGNIVKNALDHTNSGGEIHISWNRSPAMLRILITDNGSGISPEDLHHVFKRFYRSKKSLDMQGIGLGLSLAKAIVEGQGGIISVQSALHEGTVFTLSFLTEP